MWAILFGIDSRAKTVKLAIGKIVLLSVDANDVPRPGRLVQLLSLKAHLLMNWLLR